MPPEAMNWMAARLRHLVDLCHGLGAHQVAHNTAACRAHIDARHTCLRSGRLLPAWLQCCMHIFWKDCVAFETCVGKQADAGPCCFAASPTSKDALNQLQQAQGQNAGPNSTCSTQCSSPLLQLRMGPRPGIHSMHMRLHVLHLLQLYCVSTSFCAVYVSAYAPCVVGLVVAKGGGGGGGASSGAEG